MGFCGLAAHSNEKKAVFTLFIRIYIIETINLNSTLHKRLTKPDKAIKSVKL